MKIEPWIKGNLIRGLIPGSIAVAIFLTLAVGLILIKFDTDNTSNLTKLLLSNLERPVALSNYFEIQKVCNSFFRNSDFSALEIQFENGQQPCAFKKHSPVFSSEYTVPTPKHWEINKLVVTQNRDTIIAYLISFFLIVLIFSMAIIRLLLLRAKTLSNHLSEPVLNIVNLLESKTPLELADRAKGNQSLVTEINNIYQMVSLFAEKLIDYETLVLQKNTVETTMKVAKKLAHDIRSPLTALNAFLSTSKDDERHRVVRAATKRISHIADDLLSKGKKKPDREVVSLNVIVKSIVAEKNLEYNRGKSVNIISHLPQNLSSIVNAPDLARIISNLINNSYDALPDHDGKIQIKLFSDSGSNCISVSDNGVGMPRKVLDKLNSRTPISYGKDHQFKSGSGIGVSSAHETLEKYSGSLVFSSVLGQGSVATVRLPSK